MPLSVEQTEFLSPDFSSILFFALTFIMGYIAWTVAYNQVGRLEDWQTKIQAFDKTIMTFIAGGGVTAVVVLVESLILAGWQPQLNLIDFTVAHYAFVIFGDIVVTLLVGMTLLPKMLSSKQARIRRV